MEIGNDLIVVKQLPVIEEQLKKVKEVAESRVNEALSLVCNEDTYKDVKNVRSDLNKEFTALETKRKEVKAKVLEPYDKFEKVYKECVSDIYKNADAQLKKKIDEVETGIKDEKKDRLLEFFNESKQAMNLDDSVATFEMSGIKVGMSDSYKSLQDKVNEYLNGVLDDVQLIESQENADEILVEYKSVHNASVAIRTVIERHKRIAEEEERKKAWEQARLAAQQRVEEVEKVVETESAPVATAYVEEEVIEEPIRSMTFKVYGTITQLKLVKEFLVNGGYRYE